MPKLNVQRFVQSPSCCGVAAAASLANYYNPDVNFIKTRMLAKEHLHKLKDGLYTGQVGYLLNLLGFKKVTVVSTDIGFLDYSWAGLGKRNLISTMEDASHELPDADSRKMCRDMLKFLQRKKVKNKLIIDYAFPKYIRKYLTQGIPLMFSFNWTMFFKYPKYRKLTPNPMKGDYEWHYVVCSGYTKTGVYLVDSQYQWYKYRLKQYRKGIYHAKWDRLLTCMGLNADLIIPEEYNHDCGAI